MSAKQKRTTTVSTKGQVILPKAIREARHWPAGTELVVEDTPRGRVAESEARLCAHPAERRVWLAAL